MNKKLSSKCFYCIGDWTAKTTPTEDKSFIEECSKIKQWPGELGVSNLECRLYLNEKMPPEHSILNIRKTSVVVSMPRVSFA